MSPHETAEPSVPALPSAAGGPELGDEYRRLMRWYPSRWRMANEDAMIGALLDQAEGEGRSHPTGSERFALARAGLAQRLTMTTRREPLQLVPLAIGAILSVFYTSYIIWAPDTSYPGSIGPFANPSILTCVLLVLAFGSSLLARGALAGLLSVGAAASEIVIGVLAAFHPVQSSAPWEGPNSSTVVLFVGVALVGAASFRRGWTFAAAVLVVCALVTSALVASFVEAELGYFSLVSTIMMTCAGMALCVAVGLVAGHTVRRPHNARRR